MLRKTLLLGTLLASTALAMPGYAQDKVSMEDIMKQIQILNTKVETLSETVAKQDKIIQQQAQELAAQKENAHKALNNISPAAGHKNSDIKISMSPSPKIESADGKYSFQPFGRVHMDVTHVDDDQFDHPSNGNFRRARLGVKGKLGEDFKYKTEMDFAEEAVNFKEVTLTYTGFNGADIKIGNQKPSFGMEQNTSSNYIMFMERDAATNSFTRDEEIGLNIMGYGDNWTLSGGVFNQDAQATAGDPDEDITLDIRGSIDVLGQSDPVLHLGGGVSYRKPEGNINFDAALAGEGPDIIDTGAIGDVEHVSVYGAELAALIGSFSFQGEYFKADVSRDNGSQDADFDGYYAQAGWFLTGEKRPYKRGNFSRIKPQKPFSLGNDSWGAWEILARYGQTDLNDNSAGITGGELKTYAAGVNWYLTDYIRIMGNITQADTDDDAATAANDDPVVYNLRAQWDF